MENAFQDSDSKHPKVPAGSDSKADLEQVDASQFTSPSQTSSTPASPASSTTAGAVPTANAPWWPLVCLSLLSLGLNFATLPLVASAFNSGIPVDLVTSALSGCMLGQAAMAALIAGLATRRWIYGLLASTVLCAAGMSLLFLGQSYQYSVSVFFTDAAWMLPAIPLVLLAAGLPFFLLRLVRGWYLTRSLDEPNRGVSGIDDLLISTAVVGAILFFARVPQVAWETNSSTYWPVLGILCASFSLVSAIVIVPATFISFRVQNARKCITLQFVFSATLAILVIGGYVFANSIPVLGGGGISSSELVAPLGMTLPPCFAFFVGTWILRASGVRLASFPRATIQPDRAPRATQVKRSSDDSPWDDDSPSVASHAREVESKFWPRMAAGFLFLIALSGSVMTQFIDTQRKAKESAVNALASELLKSGGSVIVENREITSLKLGPTANDAKLEEYEHLRQLKRLDLSGTRITDAAYESIKKFRQLESLNLSQTQITSSLLKLLHNLPNLEALSISGTNLQPSEVEHFLVSSLSNKIQELDLSEMDWSVAELKSIGPSLVRTKLALRGYALTDSQLEAILQDSYISELDVQDNALNGSFLSRSSAIGSVDLRGNPLTQAGFGSALTSTNLNALILGGSEITDTIIPHLEKTTFNRLVLDDSDITEARLARSTLSASQLSLHARQLSGECFKTWDPGCYKLCLSGSGISDDTVEHLGKLTCGYVDLSSTQLTDAALPILGKLPYQHEIDLGHTVITAEGLSRGELSGFQTVYLAPGQFTNAEIKRIRAAINVKIGKLAEQF